MSQLIDELTPSTAAQPALRRLRAGVGIALLFVLVQLLAGSLVASAGLRVGAIERVSVRDVLVLVLLEALLLAGGLVVLQARGGWRSLALSARGRVQARGWYQLAPACGVVIVPGLLLAMAGRGGGGETGVLAAGLTCPLAIALVAFACLVSVTEELWFRGLVMNALGGRAHPWMSVVGSSLLFGAPHLVAGASGPSAATVLNTLAVTLAVAIPFACVRVASSSIVPHMGWHAVIDIWAFLHTGSIVARGEPQLRELAVGLVIPGLLAAGYLLWLARVLQRRCQAD